MKKRACIIIALLNTLFSFAQNKVEVKDYLYKEFPYEFVANTGVNDDDYGYTSRANYLLSGTDVWFVTHWNRLPRPESYEGAWQQIDRVEGNVFYMSIHVHSAQSQEKNQPMYKDAVCALGRLKAGDYKIVLSAMDDAGKMEFTPYEILFTVKENPLSVPNGIISLGPLKRDEEADSKEPSLSVMVEGDDLHVTGLLNYVCGMDHYIYYEVNGDSIKLETIQAGYCNRRDCNGLHPVDFKIPYEGGNQCTISLRDYHCERTYTFDVTGIAPVQNGTSAGSFYDLLGRPVTHPTKGIYIQNGKKVIIK